MTPTEANDYTCATMERATREAAAREQGTTYDKAWLLRWTRLRMSAYVEGAFGWCREDMAEWVAMDVALDDDDAYNLCDEAGWPEGAQG